MLTHLLSVAKAFSITALSTLVLSACGIGMSQRALSISNAHVALQPNGDYVGFVSIQSSDLHAIAVDEHYVRLYLFECDRPGNRYPADLKYGEIDLDDFKAIANIKTLIASNHVDLKFDLPERIRKSYPNGCVKVMGGQMSGGIRAESNTIRLDD